MTKQVFVGAVPRTQHARHIVFADFNRDGRMDLFIADHGNDNEPFGGWPNTLVLSAPGGRLVDASANLPAEHGFTHAAAAGDVNGDGSPDLYVGNICCGAPPEILINDGGGHFSQLAGALPSSMIDYPPVASDVGLRTDAVETIDLFFTQNGSLPIHAVFPPGPPGVLFFSPGLDTLHGAFANGDTLNITVANYATATDCHFITQGMIAKST